LAFLTVFVSFKSVKTLCGGCDERLHFQAAVGAVCISAIAAIRGEVALGDSTGKGIIACAAGAIFGSASCVLRGICSQATSADESGLQEYASVAFSNVK
jgi:hypothetical protein